MRRSSAWPDRAIMSRYSRCSSVRAVLDQEGGHAEHAVHGRAQLVAHHREEVALAARGLFGMLAGDAVGLLGPVAIGDVGDGAHDAGRPAVGSTRDVDPPAGEAPIDRRRPDDGRGARRRTGHALPGGARPCRDGRPPRRRGGSRPIHCATSSNRSAPPHPASRTGAATHAACRSARPQSQPRHRQCSRARPSSAPRHPRRRPRRGHAPTGRRSPPSRSVHRRRRTTTANLRRELLARVTTSGEGDGLAGGDASLATRNLPSPSTKRARSAGAT